MLTFTCNYVSIVSGIYAASDKAFGLSGLIFGKDDHGHGHETEAASSNGHEW